MKMHHIVFLVLAEPNNRKSLLNVSDNNQDFQQLLWHALQATGVAVETSAPATPVKETIVSGSPPNHRRAAMERYLVTLANSPQLRLQLSDRLEDRVALERLVGLFACMKLFKASWQQAAEAYMNSLDKEDSSGDDSSGSLQGMHVVSGGDSEGNSNHDDDDDVDGGARPMEQIDVEVDDIIGRFKRPRLSDGSDSSKDSLASSESSGSSNGGAAAE